MRQVLLRINLADPWSLEPIGGVQGIGSGYLLLMGLLVWLAMTAWEYRRTKGFLFGSLIMPAIAVGLVLFLADRTPPMMRNGLPIFGYGVMVFCGFLFGGWSALRRADKIGWDRQLIWDLIPWIFIAGIAGARIFYLATKDVYSGVRGVGDFVFRSVNLTDGGLVLLGGVIAVAVAVIAFCIKRRISPLAMGDLIIPSFFIGLGFGRLGCLMNGCCFGDRCSLPWAIHFPQESAAWGALYVRGYLGEAATMTYGLHPTQIYSSITAFLLAALTAAFFWRRPFEGSVLVLGMLLYSIQRFLIEFLRGDEFGQLGTIFTPSQLISGAIFVAGLTLWGVLSWMRSRPDHVITRWVDKHAAVTT